MVKLRDMEPKPKREIPFEEMDERMRSKAMHDLALKQNALLQGILDNILIVNAVNPEPTLEIKMDRDDESEDDFIAFKLGCG